MAKKKYEIREGASRVSESAVAYKAQKTTADFSVRHLRRGESFSYSSIGIPSARLQGDGVRILRFPDRTEAVMGPEAETVQRMLDFIFAALVQANEFLNPEELYFLRSYLNISQQQLADRVGVARETINAYEKGREPINAVITGKIQHTFLAEGFGALSRVADQFKYLDVRKFDKLQEELAKKAREGFKAARGVKLVIRP